MIKEIVVKAYQFANEKHKGQTRKFSTLPYFSHPKWVGRKLEDYSFADPVQWEYVVAAGILHDVLEDTDTSEAELLKEFGETITDLVVELTTDVVGKEGKAEYLAGKMSNMSRKALTIKLVDRLHNCLFLDGLDDHMSFVASYLKETAFILNKIEHERLLAPEHRDLIDKLWIVLKYFSMRYDLNK